MPEIKTTVIQRQVTVDESVHTMSFTDADLAYMKEHPEEAVDAITAYIEKVRLNPPKQTKGRTKARPPGAKKQTCKWCGCEFEDGRGKSAHERACERKHALGFSWRHFPALPAPKSGKDKRPRNIDGSLIE